MDGNDKFNEDVEKFTALLEYVDKRDAQAKEDADNVNLGEAINKTFNKKINKTLFRTVSAIVLSVFFTILGLLESNNMLVSYVSWGVYSVVFLITVFLLLYRTYIKKKRLPAIIIIAWSCGLIGIQAILTFFFSVDSPFTIIPLYKAYGGLVYCLEAGMANKDTGIAFTVSAIFLAVVTLVLAIVGLILTKKNVQVKKIPTVALAIGLGAIVVISFSLIGAGAVKEVNSGSFVNSSISANAVKKTVFEDGIDLFIQDYKGKTLDEVQDILGEDFVRAEDDDKYISFKRKNSNIRFKFNFLGDTVVTYKYYIPYKVMEANITTDEIREIAKGSLNGKSYDTVVNGLFNSGLIPTSATVFSERTEFNVYVDIQNDGYQSGYYNELIFIFTDGILTASGERNNIVRLEE